MALSILLAGTPGLPLIGLAFVAPVVLVLLIAASWFRGSGQSFLVNVIAGTIGTIALCLSVMKWGDAYPTGTIKMNFSLFFLSGAIMGAIAGPVFSYVMVHLIRVVRNK